MSTAPGLATPHEPADECADLHCYWHNVDEPSEGAYRVCFECGHVYKTAEELRAAFMAEIAPDFSSPPSEAPPAEKIWGCPYCCHDF